MFHGLLGFCKCMPRFIQMTLLCIQIWSSWRRSAADTITNSSENTYLMNMKRTRTGLKYADKNSIATTKDCDISNQNDEGPKSRRDPSKINQLSPRSQNWTELSSSLLLSNPSINNNSVLPAKNIMSTSMPATSINSR